MTRSYWHRQYVFIDDAGNLPLRRAQSALSVPGVASAAPLFLSSAALRHPVTGDTNAIFTVGVDLDTVSFQNPENHNRLSVLTIEDSALMDRRSTLNYGPLPIGAQTELNGHRIRIRGDIYNGAGFISGAILMVSAETFSRIIGTSVRSPNAVLLNFSPDADPDAVLTRLKDNLTGDVQVLTRNALQRRERHFFMSVNPIGIMFTSGAVIAFLVGAVILYQILSSEVIHHLREYATLKSMGYTNQDLKGVVMAQGLLMTVAGFIPSALLASVLYKMLRDTVLIPVHMTPGLLMFILTTSLIMSGLSGQLAVQRIQRVDPAELFS